MGGAADTVPSDGEIHPYLRGNFAPVTEEFISYACDIEGEVPNELLGGQYIRNGGNPAHPPSKGRHYHWFDGDGMLHGVLFPTSTSSPPKYTNRHMATPMLTLALLLLRSPIPSIALLVSPLNTIHRILVGILRAFFLLVRARVSVLSVANTAVIWWGQGMGSEAAEEIRKEIEMEAERMLDTGVPVAVGEKRPGLERRETTRSAGYKRDHRLLATCESGPPLEVRLPELETVRWDRLEDAQGENLSKRRGKRKWYQRFGLAMYSVSEDWITAHPRVDPVDGSLLFYSTPMFTAPHVLYSVIDRKGNHLVWKAGVEVGRAKMMHDFAATRTHTIIMNLPLTMSPANFFSVPPLPLIHFDRNLPSEYIVFPRLLGSSETPQQPCSFIDPEPSLTFHSANSWDERDTSSGKIIAINMLGCRFKSAKLVYNAGAIDLPPSEAEHAENDTIMLYYQRFLLPSDYTTNTDTKVSPKGTISHSFPLSLIPMEFPSTHPQLEMQDSQFIYGCTMRSGTFDERLGGAAKVDALVKVDVRELIRRGRERGKGKYAEAVDSRSAPEILELWRKGEKGPIEIFALPKGWYAQEPRFVPRQNATSEDDGFLLSYVYDERNLLPDGTPSTGPGSGSELWVIDAKRMHEGMNGVLCRVKLPQRVPYGLHGTFLPPSLMRNQRPLPEPLPDQPLLQDKLAHSRMRYLVSILFDRPSKRDMSRFERFVLAVMWPLAAGLLGLAIVEVFNAWLISRSTPIHVPRVVSAVARNLSSTIGSISGQHQQSWDLSFAGSKLPGLPLPQVFAGFLAVGTAALRSGFWRETKRKEVEEVPQEDLPPLVVDE